MAAHSAPATAITIGSDHAGFAMKQTLIEHIRGLSYTVNDVGCPDTTPVDYPDFAAKVAHGVQAGGRGILLCGSGIGASVAANKVPGVRAGLAHDGYSAHQGVEHDDMNILVLGARVIGIELAKDLVTTYLAAKFTGEARHLRRLGKVAALEAAFAETYPAASGRFPTKA